MIVYGYNNHSKNSKVDPSSQANGLRLFHSAPLLHRGRGDRKPSACEDEV